VAPDRAALLRDLRGLITRSTPSLTGILGDNALLISSGVLESATLVDVALWVEDHVGTEIDLGAFDLATEWDSLNAIVDFVERRTGRAARSAAEGASDRV
jgi:acyl carrier protein